MRSGIVLHVKVQRLAWLGVRTDRYEPTKDFVSRVLGLPLVAEEDAGLAIYSLPGADNDYVEVFRSDNPEGHFMTTGPVVGLLVDDVRAAHAEIQAENLEILEPITWARDFDGFEDATDYAWFQFRGPDGNVYCCMQGSLTDLTRPEGTA